jgi:hypothetical protein
MKNLFFFLLISATFCLIGCGDDDAPAEFITATINGDSFDAITIQDLVDNTGGEDLVFILGTDTGTGVAIGLNIIPSIGTGSFNVDPTDLTFTFTSGASAFFTEGTLVLTTNDTNDNVFEGTFDFVATDTVDPSNVFNITDGEFRITY